MLTVALNDDLYVAYSAQTGALYKAWRGDVELDGAVYTTAHGPQPLSMGRGWLQNETDNPWTIISNGQESKPELQYRGHRFENGQVYIQTELKAPGDAAPIIVSERPEYLAGPEGQAGLERVFTVKQLSEDTELLLDVAVQSLPVAASLETNGNWMQTEQQTTQQNGIRAVNLKGKLKLNKNGSTRLATHFVKLPTLADKNSPDPAGVSADTRSEGERLIERNGCKTCHNQYVRTVGPAYNAVAERYPNTAANREMLAGRVKNGAKGKWGQAAMIAHPQIPDVEINKMVAWVMSLDADTDAGSSGENTDSDDFKVAVSDAVSSSENINDDRLRPGLRIKVWQDIPPSTNSVNDLDWNSTPDYEGAVSEIEIEGASWGSLEDFFAAQFTGYLRVPETSNYLFRLRSDDGSRLFIDGQQVILHDGLHGASPMDGELALQAGNHPIRLDFFENGGGQAVFLEWRSFFSPEWEIIPMAHLGYDADMPFADLGANPMRRDLSFPGDGERLAGVHPSYTLSQARPNGFAPKVGGMDFLSDGRLVISTWDAEGAVYVLDGVQSGNPAEITYKKIATGLAEPLGLKVVNDTIYVAQKQEVTMLLDHNGDEEIDEYRTVANGWAVSANFHEFTFGLAHKEPYLYATLAIAILPGGASADPQIPSRGKAVRINRHTGELEYIASGLRTPNGIGIGVDGELFIADNQGDWLPSSKILHLTEGAFFNSYAVEKNETKTPKQPVVWLPQDVIGNSPSTPTYLEDGPYKGQMIHGEVTHGGIKRVFVEEVDGEYQGAVFRFIQGLEAGVNRIVWGPDTALYVGMVGSTGNWGDAGKLMYGLQRLKYNGEAAFEMLAVRAKSNGLEIELTQPLARGLGGDADTYRIAQWRYVPTANYGGPRIDEVDLDIAGVHISEDRRTVFLELPGMKEGHVVHLRLPYDWMSEAETPIWSTEAWYTLNSIPSAQPGFNRPAPNSATPNTLSKAEQDAGWKLLFNGHDLRGWHTYGQDTVGKAWKVNSEGSLYLDTSEKDGWQVKGGGDIVTDQSYENYELELEWKIAPCGNSGIIYNIVEDDQSDYMWQTGPEMQILDNSCHPDAQYPTHRAATLYDMLEVSQENVKSVGQWNKVRLVVTDGQVKHYLNNRLVVEYPNVGKEWERMIKRSKFKDMKLFGKSTSGRIGLQDHGDGVWFRNVKVRELE
ncbi:glycosyl hydrolase [Lewinellaceae bacterium SD302]|nr:glycosyl hydrolase [Lewinellaceae bacterium SD302]